MKCKTNACQSDAGRFKYCPSCREKLRLKSVAFRTGLRSLPHKCETEKCQEMVPAKSHFCEKCREERNSASKKASNMKRAEQRKQSTAPVSIYGPQQIKSEEQRLAEVRARLDPVLMQRRLLRGALPELVGNLSA